MNPILLLVTIWFSFGDKPAVTTDVIHAPSYEMCQQNTPLILEQIKKQGVTIGGKTYKIEEISGVCLEVSKPRTL